MPDESAMRSIDWQHQKDFEFVYEVGFAKEFAYQLPQDEQVTEYKIGVNQEEVENAIKRVRQQHGSMESPEVSEAGDVLFCDMRGKEGETITDFVLSEVDVKEEAKEKLVGLKVDDVFSSKLLDLFADEATIARVLKKEPEEVAAFTDEYDFEVTHLTRRTPAELNEEFYKKAFGEDTTIDSEEAFRAKVEEDFSKNYQRDTDFLLERDVIKAIIENTEIELPEAFLKKFLANREEEVDEATIDQQFTESIEQLKWSLIKEKIVQEYELKAEYDEVFSKTQEMFGLGPGGGNAAMAEQMNGFINDYLQKENGQNFMQVHGKVLDGKILQALKDKVTFDVKTVTIEEFQELAKA